MLGYGILAENHVLKCIHSFIYYSGS